MLEQVIINKMCGTITPFICKVSDNECNEVVFVIKDESGYIRKIGNSPKVEFKSGIANINNTIAFMCVVNINDNKDLMYEFCLDYYSIEGRKIINSLCIQNRIIFQARDKSINTPNQFLIGNKLMKLANDYRRKCLEHIPWTKKDFIKTRYYINRQFEYTVDIWNRLGC